MRLLVVLLISSLFGCGLSPSYREEKRAQEGKEAIAKCEGMGFSKNTPEIRDCAMRISGSRIEIR